jgi:hypothetical protein
VFGAFKALKRLSELEEELTKLKRLVADRELDWLDMRARCKRLLDRTEKAARTLQDGGDDGNVSGDQPLNGDEGMAGLVHHALTPRQRAIQNQILRHRMPGGK